MSTCKSLDEETAASLHALALGDIGPAELPANVVAQVRLFFLYLVPFGSMPP